jgi:CRISPR-associated protein Cmr5
MHHTRRVLEAWVYFKRFAKSVLKVEAGGDDEGR